MMTGGSVNMEVKKVFSLQIMCNLVHKGMVLLLLLYDYNVYNSRTVSCKESLFLFYVSHWFVCILPCQSICRLF